MTRKVHLVGAWPGRSAAGAMEKALDELGPDLERLSDGETGLRDQWITPTIELLRANPDVDKIADGDYTHYLKTPKYKLKDDKQFDPANLDLGYAHAFEMSYPQFKVLRERHGRPDLPFQVGIPHVNDLAVMGFAEEGFKNPEIVKAFSDATLRDVEKIFSIAGDDVVFQIESILGPMVVANAPDAEKAGAAAGFAKGVTDFVARCPEGSRWGMHLCLGDFNHESFSKIPTVEPWVLSANEMVKNWPEGRTLDYIHAPFAAAAEPPPDDESFYAPVADLELGDVKFIAGFVHEHKDLDFHKQILARIEGLYGGEVDVAASCGLGRRPDESEAWDAMDKAKALVGEPSAAPH